MKIVIAVDEDKQTIIKRTGQSAFFAIYEDDKILEYIPNKRHGGKHHAHTHEHEHNHSHRKDVQALKDCDIFLVQALGENMKEALDTIGLKAKKVREKHGSTADELVRNFLNNEI